MALIILGIAWAIGTRTGEIQEEIENQRRELQKLNERLKIYEMLIDMKSDIKEMQKRIK